MDMRRGKEDLEEDLEKVMNCISPKII